jgi:hypothetical protein
VCGLGGWDKREIRRKTNAGETKEDECGRSEYKGGNSDEQDSIFCFEGGNEGRPVWMV